MAHKTDAGAEPPRPAMREIATTGGGRDITRGFVAELLTPEDSVLRATGKGLEVYARILRDDQVQSTFQQRRLAVVSRGWQVEPGGDGAADQAAADFLKEQLEHIGWDRVTDRMLYGVFYGYAVAECLWATDGGRIVLDAVKVRNRRRFRFAADGSLRLITRDKPLGEELPERKFWTFATGADHDDEPYGLGLGHWLYWPAFFKRHGLKFWLIFLDKFGSPTPKGTYGPNTTPDEQTKLLAALAAIHTDSGIIVPEGMAIELIEAARRGGADYGDMYGRMDAAIAKVVLSQTMTTDPGSSLSQAKVHMEVRDEVVSSDSSLVNESFGASPARWLTEWNFAGAAVPKLSRVLEDPEDLGKRAERDEKLHAMGFDPSEQYINETYGGDWTKRREGAANAAFAEATDDDDTIDGLVRAALEEEGWEALMDPVLAPLRDLVAGAASFEELKEKLAEVVGDMDIDRLADVLSRAAFSARAAGEVGAAPHEGAEEPD